MFYVEDNKEIGKYLDGLINKNYRSRRQFCGAYLEAVGISVNDDELRKMNNRFTQIVKGKKGLQLLDLPIITELFGISCEELLSCGKTFVPVSSHVTNYDIAFSKDKKVWAQYMEREDKLFLNCDEYGKTVLDYAFEFKNYSFLKYLMDKKFIWLVDNSGWENFGYGGGTSIKRRDIGDIDSRVPIQIKYEDEIRTNVIALAIENKDMKMLDELKARENPSLRLANYSPSVFDVTKYYNERLVEAIASADTEIIDYYSEEISVENVQGRSNTFMFPYIGGVIDLMIKNQRKEVEILLRKSIKHNKNVYEQLEDLAEKEYERIKEYYQFPSDDELVQRFQKDVWRGFDFSKQNHFVALYCSGSSSLISNIIKVTKKPTEPLLRELVEELNHYYDLIASKGGKYE